MAPRFNVSAEKAQLACRLVGASSATLDVTPGVAVLYCTRYVWDDHTVSVNNG